MKKRGSGDLDELGHLDHDEMRGERDLFSTTKRGIGFE